MNRQDFPAGVFPDVLSVGGWTFCVYSQRGAGLVMRRWLDGAPADRVEWVNASVNTKAYAKLNMYNGELYVAYYRDVPDSRVVVSYGATGMPAAPWAMPFNGNDPVVWGPSGLIAAQDVNQDVLFNQFPREPSMFTRHGAPTGLSRFATEGGVSSVRLIDEDNGLIPGCLHPVWLADGTVVGEAAQGGVAVRLPGEMQLRIFEPGTQKNNPRGTRQANGLLTLVWWDAIEGSVTAVGDITNEDLVGTEPLPVDFSLRAFPRKVWVAPFYEVSAQYGVADTLLGNAVQIVAPGDVPLCPTDRARIVSSSAYDAAWVNLTVAYWASGGNVNELRTAISHFDGKPEKPIIAHMDSGDIFQWPETKPSWITDKVWPSVQAYRGFAEPIDWFRARLEATLDRVASYGKPMGLTPGFYDRRSAQGQLTLSEMEECIPLFDKWMQTYPIVVLQPFARRRPGGTIDYPVMEEWLRRLGLMNPVRPNRYDWWTPTNTSLEFSLTNKLSQSVELISLTRTEKDFLLAAIQ